MWWVHGRVAHAFTLILTLQWQTGGLQVVQRGLRRRCKHHSHIPERVCKLQVRGPARMANLLPPLHCRQASGLLFVKTLPILPAATAGTRTHTARTRPARRAATMASSCPALTSPGDCQAWRRALGLLCTRCVWLCCSHAWQPGVFHTGISTDLTIISQVLWGNGGATSDILAAIDSAVRDGCDIISFSMGVTVEPWIFTPIESAFFGAAAAGVFVSASGGALAPCLLLHHQGLCCSF